MLKKLGIAGVIAATVSLGITGIAFAGDFSGDHGKSHHKAGVHHKSHHGDDSDDHEAGINCSSHEEFEQHNEGKQLIGGNLSLKNITGFIGGVIDKPAVCPEIANDNEINFQ